MIQDSLLKLLFIPHKELRLKKILKYLIRIADKIDVSPIEGDTLFKVIIYLVWGLNAIFFIGRDAPPYIISHDADVTYKVSTSTQSFSPIILDDHNVIVFHSSEFGTISSYDVELINPGVTKFEHERSPPLSLL